MEQSAIYKEQQIQQYVNNINFSGDFSVSKIKSEMKSFLNEFPGVQIKYKKESILVEDAKGNKIEQTEEKVKSIEIAFSDGDDSNGRPIVHKVEYFV